MKKWNVDVSQTISNVNNMHSRLESYPTSHASYWNSIIQSVSFIVILLNLNTSIILSEVNACKNSIETKMVDSSTLSYSDV